VQSFFRSLQSASRNLDSDIRNRLQCASLCLVSSTFEGKRALWRPKLRWRDNTLVYFSVRYFECADVIHIAKEASSPQLLWTRKCTSSFHPIRRISLLTLSQELLNSSEWVGCSTMTFNIPSVAGIKVVCYYQNLKTQHRKHELSTYIISGNRRRSDKSIYRNNCL